MSWPRWLPAIALLSALPACSGETSTNTSAHAVIPEELSPRRWLRGDNCDDRSGELFCPDLTGPHHVIDATRTPPPERRPDGLGGHAALVFGEPPQHLVLGEAAPETLTAYTVVAVIAPDAPAGWRGVVWGCETECTAALSIEPSGDGLRLRYGEVAGPIAAGASTVVAVRVDGKGHELYLGTTRVGRAETPVPAVETCLVGHEYRGAIAEVIVFGRALPDDDLAALQRGLAAAYSIDLQAPNGEIGRVIEFTPPPRPTPAEQGYPIDSAGRAILGEQSGVTVVLDPAQRNPVATMTRCHQWLQACYDHHGDMDDCYRSAPSCAGDTPWQDDAPCCPTDCYDNYATRRRAGVRPLRAMVDTARDGSCFPGLTAYVQGGAP